MRGIVQMENNKVQSQKFSSGYCMISFDFTEKFIWKKNNVQQF